MQDLRDELAQHEVPSDSTQTSKERQVDDLESKLESAQRKNKEYEERYKDSMR